MNDGLCRLTGVQCNLTSAYHPQSNGLDEHFNQTLQRQLLKFVDTEQKSKADTDTMDTDDHWVSVKEIKLTHQDRETLNSQEWLNNNHISAAQYLLKKQHPEMSGLQPPTLQYTQTFDVHHNSEFVQCLNLANNHWITVSTVGCVPGVVNVYDSLHLGLSSSLKRTIANLLHTSKPTIFIQQPRMQQQTGRSDCGLFAVATATAICNGQKPETIRFDQTQMRQHLLKSLDEKLLLPFPSTKTSRRFCFERESMFIVHVGNLMMATK